jgi:uncharacterized protein (TIGR00251 family)
MIALTNTAGGVVFSVKVVPGSSRTRYAGTMGTMMKVNIAAAPEKGKANECLVDYLADLLGIRKNAVSILSGRTCPVKQIRVEGIASDAIRQILDSTIVGKKK